MTYHQAVHFAHVWGMISLLILFVGASAYALWPSNREKFEHASRAPLEEDDHVGP